MHSLLAGQDIGDTGDLTTDEAVRLATAASTWSQHYHNTSLSKLTLDPSTLTEVLRLHLLASGGRCSDKSAKWRFVTFICVIILSYPIQDL